MTDFSNLNELPTEIKLLIVKAQTLLNDTKEKMSDRNYPFDLTSKWQLKSDCKHLEKCIQKIVNGNSSDKQVKDLENSIIRLETLLNGLINFFTRG